MIELFDKKFKIDDDFNVYGIVNVQEDKYNIGLTQFVTSNYCQIKKILSEHTTPIYVAVSVNPSVNTQKNSKIREIVEINTYKLIGDNSAIKSTTGYCTVYCRPIINFNELAQNRTFFEIRPHGQYLIKQLFPVQSEKIVSYIKKNIGVTNG